MTYDPDAFDRQILRERGRDLPHGTVQGYGYWRCRCRKCRDAHRDAARALRAKR